MWLACSNGTRELCPDVSSHGPPCQTRGTTSTLRRQLLSVDHDRCAGTSPGKHCLSPTELPTFHIIATMLC